MTNYNDTGFLVHLFVGEKSPAELAVLRKISMKYGLTSWDVMKGYLPWRSRVSIRSNMTKLIRKQALSEYSGIRADPLQIRSDNERYANQITQISENSDYVYKGGVLVSTKWDRSTEEWNSIRKTNSFKYSISEEEAENINVPSIISVDYIKQQCFRHRQSQLLYRAALRAEIARRKNQPIPDLGVKDIQFRSGRDVVVEPSCTRLSIDPRFKEYFFTPQESDN